jgi:hypothetical protein
LLHRYRRCRVKAVELDGALRSGYVSCHWESSRAGQLISEKLTEMDVQTTRKRKRATVACCSCHARKVRCNVSLQPPGAPCANCAQDNIACRIYGQQPTARPGQPLRPREASAISPHGTNLVYPLTPSPGSAHTNEVSHEAVRASSEHGNLAASHGRASFDQQSRTASAIGEQSPEVLGNARRERSPNPDPANLVPYYAGR